MAERRTTVDGLADAIMDGLKEYADLATDTVKDAVKDVSKTVKKDIQANAPKRGFLASERVDGKLILSEAVKTLDIKAAGK
jgi:hypothetical protein